MKRKKKLVDRNIKKQLLYLILFPLYFLSCLVPKKKELVVLGSSLGIHFSDNPKYLYLYLESIEEKPFQYYWLTKNKQLYIEMIKKTERVLYIYSFKGILILLRANIVIVSHQLDDLFPPLLGGKKIIQLWHGTPIKKIGFDTDNWDDISIKGKIKNLIKRIIILFFPYMHYMHCHKVIIASENVKDIFMSAFKLKAKDIVVLGQPRNDTFYSQSDDNGAGYILDLKTEKYSKIVSWLPTHRGRSGLSIIDLLENYSFNTNIFDKFLQENNYLLVIKPHFVERNDIHNFIAGSKNIIIYEDADPYPLLKQTDILLTDYSSVYIDFLLTGKPIIFCPFDYNYYIGEIEEFYYDYFKITPGFKCKNWVDVIEVLDNYSKGIKYNETHYEEINKFFNKYTNNNSKRVTEYICNLIYGNE